ncbi:hypothetical protein CYY_006024 [Polysphondylium violaceum]|uniref:Lipocalin/cytosolic fatty-acid binding domain-containing protein n=1 Tax=Polysphondylium violaceum TaxID=133409 RepID=A0A8J4PU65_9MYCE|nr:hypothetical protein CYY_006024 [Polysphondylium violaceum]
MSVSPSFKLSALVMFGLILSVVKSSYTPSGVTVVQDFQGERYLGQWYEIARFNHIFERGMDHVTATYSTRPDGGLDVLNRGFKVEKNQYEQKQGVAYYVGSNSTATLKVAFFASIYSGYNVIDTDYETYSLVCGPTRDYLWILARTPSLDKAIVEKLEALAQSFKFNTNNLIFVNQEPQSEATQEIGCDEIQTLVNTLYDSVNQSSRWDKESCQRAFMWIQHFEEYVHYLLARIDIDQQYQIELNKFKENIDTIIKNTSVTLNRVPLSLINSDAVIQCSLSNHLLSQWLNNIFLTEDQLDLFLSSYLEYSNEKRDEDDGDYIDYHKKRKERLDNALNIFIKISNSNNYIKVLKNLSAYCLKSTTATTNINSNIDQPNLHINNNLELRATAQLVLKYIDVQTTNNQQFDKSVLYLSIIKTIQHHNLLIWVIWLLISRPKEILHLSFIKSTNTQDSIQEIINTFNSIKGNISKLKFFLDSSNQELLSLACRMNAQIYQLQLSTIFLLIDYYIFDEKASNSWLSVDYQSKIKQSFTYILQHQPNYHKSTLLHEINQRILSTKLKPFNTKNNVLPILIEIKKKCT